MGVLLHALVCGEPPYDANSFAELRASLKKQEITFKHEAWKMVSADLVELVSLMLEKDQEERVSMAQVIAHPWLSNQNNAN